MEGTFSIRPSVCFEVQRITGVTIGEGNQRSYQVQWAPTWISGVHLVGCQHLIEEFIYQQSKKGQLTDGTGELIDNTAIATNLDELQNHPRDDSFQADYTNRQQQYKEEVYKRASMVVNDEHMFDSHDGNSSSYGNENLTVIPVSNGGMAVNSELYRDNERNPNFEWVQNMDCNNDDSSRIYNDPLSDVNKEHNLKKEFINHESGNLFRNEVLEVKREEIVVIKQPENVPMGLTNDTEYKDGSFGKDGSFSNPQKEYECKTCHKLFRNRSGLTRHCDMVHSRNAFICDRNYASKAGVVGHKSKHKCHICSKVFSEKEKLISHVRIHTGIRTFRCNFCEKTFRRNTDLICHERVHTNERPFRCKICEKRFKMNHHLQKHILTHREVPVDPPSKMKI